MESTENTNLPSECPVCDHDLVVTRLECPSCGTDVTGWFGLSRLARLREPHASLIELFLRVRGNVKDMERALGLSYPTVRARLEEALEAAGLSRDDDAAEGEENLSKARMEILDALDRGEISADQAQSRLMGLKARR
jgi:hypothetical protein